MGHKTSIQVNKTQRKEGALASKAEWMKSTGLFLKNLP